MCLETHFWEALVLMIIPRVRHRETKQGTETSTAIFPTDRSWNPFNVTHINIHTHTLSLSESKHPTFVSTLASVLRTIVSARLSLPGAPVFPGRPTRRSDFRQRRYWKGLQAQSCVSPGPHPWQSRGFFREPLQPVIYTCITPSVHRGKHVSSSPLLTLFLSIFSQRCGQGSTRPSPC